MNYELDLLIDKSDLPVLRGAGLNITIAKPQSNGGTPNTVWLAFDPFEGNMVQWEETYGIYASSLQTLDHGTSIQTISEVLPAGDGASYDFDNSGTFQGPLTGPDSPGPGIFKINNKMPYAQHKTLTFGLEQRATIRGNSVEPSPVNAAVVPSMYHATFEPITTVYIWMQAEYKSGTVITAVNGNPTIVSFMGGTTRKALAYDPNSGQFVPTNG